MPEVGCSGSGGGASSVGSAAVACSSAARAATMPANSVPSATVLAYAAAWSTFQAEASPEVPARTSWVSFLEFQVYAKRPLFLQNLSPDVFSGRQKAGWREQFVLV